MGERCILSSDMRTFCIPFPPQKEFLLVCYFQLSKQLECRSTSVPANDNFSRVSSAYKWDKRICMWWKPLCGAFFPPCSNSHDSAEDPPAEPRQASAGSRANSVCHHYLSFFLFFFLPIPYLSLELAVFGCVCPG